MEAQASDAQVSLRQPFIDIIVESWRFSKLFQRVIGKLDSAEAARYVNQLRYFQKKLDESLEFASLRLVNLEGQLFDTGMAVTPLNICDFEPDDKLVVEQMMEPILMGPDGIVKSGTVLLKRAEQL
jgi:hypothetical protein